MTAELLSQYGAMAVAVLLIIGSHFIIKLLTSKNKGSKVNIEQLISEFNPEPLVPRNYLILNPTKSGKEAKALNAPVITAPPRKYIQMGNKTCLNLATHNYINLAGQSDIEAKCIETLRKYGVGSCGPRGFYGTMDIHLDLERKLSDFMGCEEAIVYAYGATTQSSVIKAYMNHRDIVFADEKVNSCCREGFKASRCKVVYFQHNDSQDFIDKVTQTVNQSKNKSKYHSGSLRMFLVVEGIYATTGTICPLDKLIPTCLKYKIRVFVDECLSFGVLGKGLRGITEHLNVDIQNIDCVIGSMDNIMGSSGGFCVGSSFIIEHQRLGSAGYCFSASLPPVCASAAITALEFISLHPEVGEELRSVSTALHQALSGLSVLQVLGEPQVPVKHLVFKDFDGGYEHLNEICSKCGEDGLAVATCSYLEDELSFRRKSIVVCANVALWEADILKAFECLEKNSVLVCAEAN